jgi:hypothetical protein
MSEELNRPTGTPNNPPPRPAFLSTPAQPAPGSRPPGRKSNTSWIPWVLIVILGGAVIYLLQRGNKQEDNIDNLTVENVRVDSSYNSVNTEYQAALARLDDLVSKNDQMAKEINDKGGEIARLRGEIDRTLSKSNKTAADYAQAKRLIDELNRKVRGYEERIAELEGENAELTTKNTGLARERDSTVTENVGLQQKVKLGAVLHASNIRLVPIDLRRGGNKEKETTRARRVDMIRIYFDIDENRVAESGAKDLYLRIINPDGRLITSAAIGSGVTTGANGENVEYTLQKQVQLTQNERAKDVVVDWNQSDDYQRGTYQIELYNEGYQIGAGSVTLR